MDNPRHLCETVPRDSSANRQLLAEMMEELQTNQAVLKGMLKWYGVFAFTGGAVPSGQCEVAAVKSYLERPFATDSISTGEVDSYRHLIESIMMPTAALPESPRTLRCRKQITATFEKTASQINILGRRFESALMMRSTSVLGKAKV